MGKLKKILSACRDVVTNLPRKWKTAAIGIVLASLRSKWPDLPIPESDLVLDIVQALLYCHSATDMTAIVSTAIVEVAKAKNAARP